MGKGPAFYPLTKSCIKLSKKVEQEVAVGKQNVRTAWLKDKLEFTFFEPWYENNLKLSAWATKCELCNKSATF